MSSYPSNNLFYNRQDPRPPYRSPSSPGIGLLLSAAEMLDNAPFPSGDHFSSTTTLDSLESVSMRHGNTQRRHFPQQTPFTPHPASFSSQMLRSSQPSEMQQLHHTVSTSTFSRSPMPGYHDVYFGFSSSVDGSSQASSSLSSSYPTRPPLPGRNLSSPSIPNPAPAICRLTVGGNRLGTGQVPPTSGQRSLPPRRAQTAVSCVRCRSVSLSRSNGRQ